MAKSIAKESRKQKPNTEDRVMEGVVTAASWADRNRRLVMIGAVALVAVGLAGWAWLDYRSKVTERAAVRLEEIRMASATGAPAEQVRADLAEFVSQFGGTPFGDEARLYLAQAALQENDYETAIRTLEPAARLSTGTPVAFRAARSLAAAEEMRGATDEAIDWYDRIASAARFDFQAREARGEKARILAAQGDFQGAIRIYGDLRSAAEESGQEDEAGLWSLRLGELEARQATGTPLPPVPETPDVEPGSAAPPRDAPVGAPGTGADTTGGPDADAGSDASG